MGRPKGIPAHNKKTKEQFIADAITVHGGRYDYSEIDYIDCRTKIVIICKEHGRFLQTPTSHLSQRGCQKCSNKNLSKEDFILKAKSIHGNKYDYSNINYKNQTTKILINCLSHGTFDSLPSAHIGCKKQGCPKCSTVSKKNKLSRTQASFIKEVKIVHGNQYDYSESVYTKKKNKIAIICKKHGVFYQMAEAHMDGHGCRYCSADIGGVKSNTKTFIRKAINLFGDEYDYSQVDYINARTKVDIACGIHGIFSITPNGHLGGSGCPICKASKGERFISMELSDMGIRFERQKRFEDIPNHRFDFYLPDINMCIEYDGIQHYEPTKHFGGITQYLIRKKRDEKKNQFCRISGIAMHRIRYDQDIKTELHSVIGGVKIA